MNEDNLVAVQKRYREERLARDSYLAKINEEIPYERLRVRDLEARKTIFNLKGLRTPECIEAIRRINPHQIVWTKVNNQEINDILQFLGCKYRGIFSHGCSYPIWMQSRWGYFDPNIGVHSMQEVSPPPQTSIEALILLIEVVG